MPNLVYFGSPSIAIFNGNRPLSINDQILLIFFNCVCVWGGGGGGGGDPNFRLKRVSFLSSKLIPDYCMFGILAQSSKYIVCEFHEN